MELHPSYPRQLKVSEIVDGGSSVMSLIVQCTQLRLNFFDGNYLLKEFDGYD